MYDVDARHDLADRLPPATYFDVSFLPDRSGFYYSTMADAGPRVRFHRMGTETGSDQEVFGKGYAKEAVVVGDPSEDGRNLIVQVIHGSAADKVEIWTQDLTKKGPFELLTKGIDARFLLSPAETNYFCRPMNAPRGRVLAVDLAHPERERWRQIIPESDATIDSMATAGGRILVSYVKDVTSVVKIFRSDGTPAGEVAFPAVGSTAGIQSRWENHNAFIAYTSFAVPNDIYRYDVTTGKQSVWAKTKVPVDSTKFEVEQKWFPSKDGTRIPMFLIHAKGVKLDGSNPTLLTGYGGFVVSLTPSFSPDAILWVEHGGVFAQVNLRGGGEFGEAWHQAGMLDKKQNVFDDFIAASEWLIHKQYTQPSKLAIFGGSNGGLLVGAALTQRPDLYRAVVCWHPLLDMLRYDQFMEAQFWVSEYGSAKDPKQFQWLYAYSPYQHVKPGTKYPAVLFMTGDGDTRVAPLHARKMAALLQASTGSNQPVLLRYELTAGHSGGRSVTQSISDGTDMPVFLSRTCTMSRELHGAVVRP